MDNVPNELPKNKQICLPFDENEWWPFGPGDKEGKKN